MRTHLLSHVSQLQFTPLVVSFQNRGALVSLISLLLQAVHLLK